MKDFSTKEKFKLSLLSYLLMIITGIGVVLPFIIKNSIADSFNSSLSYAGFVLSFFMFGMLTTQFLNSYFVKFISLKKEIFIVSIIYIISLILFFNINSISLLIPILYFLGMGFGILATIPFYIIVNSFKNKERSSKLNLLDFGFSFGSFNFPIIAGYMLHDKISWNMIYLSVLILWAVILTLLIFTKLPKLENDDFNKNIKYSKWNSGVIIMTLVIFINFTSYMGFNYWVTDYIEKEFNLSIAISSYALSLFWFFYGIGCLIAGILLKYFRVSRYLIFSTCIIIIAYILIFNAKNQYMFFIAISILGYGHSTIYGSSIAYGTLLLKNPSPRLISLFICASGLGTLFAQQYTSLIEDLYGSKTVIEISFLLIFVILSLIIFTNIRYKRII